MLPHTKRILIVCGHYGSGKSEFSVSLAAEWAKANADNTSNENSAFLQLFSEKKRASPYSASASPPLAVVDLDIVNPYFRSREREALLASLGVPVYASMYKGHINAEIPALGAEVRAPLENPDTRVILDAGGNDAGANVLNQFRKYFTDETATMACVVNFSRFETQTPGESARQARAIESKTGLRCEYIINNTHLLRETTAAGILKGHALALETCEILGAQLFCTTYPAGIVPPEELTEIEEYLFPVGLYLRETWHDR